LILKMFDESSLPPAYPTQTYTPPSSETTTAPVYTPLYTSEEQAEAQSPSPLASRNLPPSRPLQRPDRLELTTQSTTVNIGQSSEYDDEESDNTSTSLTKTSKPFTCSDFFAMVFVLVFCGMFITMIRAAMALEENSRYLKLVYGSRQTVTKTVTQVITVLEPGLASTVTVTADMHKTEGMVTPTHEETVEETVTETVMETVMETVTTIQWV
jgi:hypothetical protein